MECWFGLDMALNDDLASLAMLFKDDERGVLWVMWRHWLTDLTRRRVDNHTHGLFSEWVASGVVDIWEYQGDWIEGPDVAEQINDLALEFRAGEHRGRLVPEQGDVQDARRGGLRVECGTLATDRAVDAGGYGAGLGGGGGQAASA